MPQCPHHGVDMVLRTARKGPRAGKQFYGCPRYPDCRFTINVDEDETGNGEGSGSEGAADAAMEALILAVPLRAQAIKRDYQVGFYESLALPEAFLEQAAQEVTVEEELRKRNKWRLDAPVMNEEPLDESQSRIITIAQRILLRGKLTLCSPHIEEEVMKYYNIFPEEYDVTYDKLQSLRRFEIGGSGNVDMDAYGRKFYQVLLPRLLGPYCHISTIPGVLVHCLLGNEQAGPEESSKHVDFLLALPDRRIVVEIDRSGPGLIQDPERARDQALSKKGLQVIRIGAREIEAEEGENLHQLAEILESYRRDAPDGFSREEKAVLAIKTIHQLQVSITEMLYNGVYKSRDNANYYVINNIEVFDSEEFRFIVRTAHNDLRDLLVNLENLYNMEREMGFNLELYEGQNDGFLISFGYAAGIREPVAIIQDMYYGQSISQPMKMERPLFVQAPAKENLEYLLHYIFRKECFWEGQYEAICRAFSGQDAIVLLPTGSGKSIAFQLASMVMSGVTIVIEPIIALINDQVDNLKRAGIDRAAGITSQVTDTVQKKRVMDLTSQGEYYFVYVSPERFQTKEFRQSLRALTVSNPVSLIVVDEAHCVSEWGHDFRTSYLNIGRVSRDYCSSNNQCPPLLALTGTASNSVLRDVQRELQVDDYEAIITPETFDRPEMVFVIKVTKSKEKTQVIKGFLQSHLPQTFRLSAQSFYEPRGKNTTCGLVFCPHVGGSYGVVEICSKIKGDMQIDARYFGGKPPKGWDNHSWNDYKRKTASDFKNNRFSVLIATKSFGMGIDKPNIRYTMHTGLPSSIESFYQEAGRAGRDRKQTECIVLVSNDYEERSRKLLDINTPPETLADIMDKERDWDTDDDITRAMFFHNKAFQGIEKELEDIRVVLENLPSIEGKREIILDKNIINLDKKDDNRVEKALHRLLVLGVIEDYTVDYASREFHVLTTGKEKEHIIGKYLEYVKGYNRGRVAQENQKMRQNMDLPREEFILTSSRILLQFIYDTIEKGRRRALREMLAATEEAAASSHQDQVFRSRILRYLESSYYDEIEAVVNADNLGFIELRELLEGVETDTGEVIGGIRSPKDAMQLRGQAARYLESLPDHPALLFLRAVSEVFCPDSDAEIYLESIKAGYSFGLGRYGVSEPVLFQQLGWIMSMTLSIARGREMYEETIEEILSYINDKEFARELIKANDTDEDMLLEPGLFLANHHAARAADILDG